MTVFPQEPKLSDPDNEGISTLLDSHLTFVPLYLGYSLMVYIGEGYKTDGASIPREELEDSKIAKEICKIIAKHYPGKDYRETLDYLVGTPFEMPRILAAIVHDALYGFRWKIRWFCDLVYRKILSVLKYDSVRRDIEYSGIRLMGWKNWNLVTDLERDHTRKIVSVEIVRNGKIPKIKERFSQRS